VFDDFIGKLLIQSNGADPVAGVADVHASTASSEKQAPGHFNDPE